MSVYKELLYVAGQVKGRSRRIWDGTCDLGVPVFSMDDPVLVGVNALRGMYPFRKDESRYLTGVTQKLRFLGRDEWEANLPFVVEFIWVTTRGSVNGMKGYLYVNEREPVEGEVEELSIN